MGDLLLLPGMAVLSHALLYGAAAPDSSQRIVFGAVILSAIVCFSVAPLYRNWRMRGLLADLWLLLLAWSATFALFSLYAVVVGLADAVPSTWLIGWYAFGLGSMAVLRVLLRVQLHRLRSRGMDHERILLVGLRAPALRLHRLLRGKPELGKDVIGYFASAGDIATRRGGDAPCRLGRLEDVPQYMDQHRGEFDQVWVSMPMGHAAAIKDMLKQIERFPVPVRLIPDTTGLGALNPGVHQVGDVPMIGVRQGLVDHRFRLFKRVEDIVVAGIAVILLAPLFALLAIGVKLSSPGPVLFRQKRHGLGGKEFWMLKFRSMRVHAEGAGQDHPGNAR